MFQGVPWEEENLEKEKTKIKKERKEDWMDYSEPSSVFAQNYRKKKSKCRLKKKC